MMGTLDKELELVNPSGLAGGLVRECVRGTDSLKDLRKQTLKRPLLILGFRG
jgi:hypothetical protein